MASEDSLLTYPDWKIKIILLFPDIFAFYYSTTPFSQFQLILCRLLKISNYQRSIVIVRPIPLFHTAISAVALVSRMMHIQVILIIMSSFRVKKVYLVLLLLFS